MQGLPRAERRQTRRTCQPIEDQELERNVGPRRGPAEQLQIVGGGAHRLAFVAEALCLLRERDGEGQLAGARLALRERYRVVKPAIAHVSTGCDVLALPQNVWTEFRHALRPSPELNIGSPHPAFVPVEHHPPMEPPPLWPPAPPHRPQANIP